MIRINLAPDRQRRRGGGFKLTVPGFNLGLLFGLLYVLAIVGVGAYWWALASEESALTAEIARKSQELASLKAVIGQSTKTKDLAEELRKRIDVIEKLTRDQAKPVVLVDTFANVIPEELWITRLEERNSVVRIAGAAFSTTAVSNFMSNLRSSGKFKDVDIIVSRRDVARPSSPVTFEVTCRFEG